MLARLAAHIDDSASQSKPRTSLSRPCLAKGRRIGSFIVKASNDTRHSSMAWEPWLPTQATG